MRVQLTILLAVSAALTACATRPPRPVAGGCWVDVYAEPGYRGAVRSYTGPTYEQVLTKDAGSLAVGPGARLEGFRDPALKKESVVLAPGTRVSDVRRIQFEKRVDSFELICVGPQGRR